MTWRDMVVIPKSCQVTCSLADATAAKGDSDFPKASQSSSSSANNAPSAGASGRGFIERLGSWSTFGRRQAPPPSINEFGEQIQISPSRSAWRTHLANSRRSSRQSSKTTSLRSSPAENKENTPRLSSQSSLGRRTGSVSGHSNRSSPK